MGWIDPLGLTSCELSKAMEKNGTPRPKDSAAHHIVPETAKGAKPARDILKKHKIDVNGADNGVFLPNRNNTDGMSGILHNGKHPDDYISAINNRIESADIRGGKQEVINELGRINDILSSANRNSSWYTILL
ncbi:AHH domain-containing protein [Citrobacter werkmanii]|uniref:AHH domain-containing protein n=1 Tax=Citrobacter werkmanii TaxID=67827 RepID=UPI00254ABDB8|nr:AHH domain-containing protein [Citrobacter werkmanii]